MNISDRLRNIKGSATAQIFAKARELENSGKSIIHLEIGQPDFGPPEAVINATIKALKENKTSYTVSRGIEPLREAIASHHQKIDGVILNHKSEVIITSGAKLGIFASVWTVVNPGDNVIVLNPSWVSYGGIIESLGAEVRYVGVDMQFNFDPTKLAAATDNKTKALILNSPSNPTGALISKENLQFLADHCQKNDILLISDEIYSNYIYEGVHHSLSTIENWKEFGLIIDGFSKTFSMTGFRLGYVLGRKELIDEINKVNQLTASCPVNFGQHAAIAALNNITEMKQFIADTMFERRKVVVDKLTALGLEFQAPQGAIYAWFKVPSQDSTQWVSDLLNQQGVALTPGIAFGPDGEGFARICFATAVENLIEGIDRIGSFLKS